eukprot:1055625-Prorocentrum_minimum.AAC.4
MCTYGDRLFLIIRTTPNVALASGWASQFALKNILLKNFAHMGLIVQNRAMSHGSSILHTNFGQPVSDRALRWRCGAVASPYWCRRPALPCGTVNSDTRRESG